MYIVCMARKVTTTIRLDQEDAKALARARKDGVSASELIRRGLRVVGAQYYRGAKRPPKTGLFVSTNPKLGSDETVFDDLEP